MNWTANFRFALVLGCLVTAGVVGQGVAAADSYQIGERVEATLFGTPFKGKIVGIDAEGKYLFLPDGSDTPIARDIQYLKHLSTTPAPPAGETRTAAPSPAPAIQAPKATPAPYETTGADCTTDGTAQLGPLDREQLMQLSAKPTVANDYLVCQVRTRRISFQLTTQDEAALRRSGRGRVADELRKGGSVGASNSLISAGPKAVAPGTYVCSVPDSLSALGQKKLGPMQINSGSSYHAPFDKSGGTYRYDAGRRMLHFLGGGYDQRGSGSEWVGLYYEKGESFGNGGRALNRMIVLYKLNELQAGSRNWLQECDAQ